MVADGMIEEYLADLARRGRGPHTLRGYRSDLRAILEQQGADRSLAPSSAARRRSAARGFALWARTRGIDIDSGVLDRAANATAPAGPGLESGASAAAPDPDAVRAALGAIPRQADRDHLLFRLPAQAGLRPGEVLGLRGDAFDEASGHLAVTGWGGRRRLVLVDDTEVCLRLVHWIRATDPGHGPLFLSPHGNSPLRYQSMAGRWARYTATAGVRVRLGGLRLFHAAELLAGGVPEWAVRERIGQPRGPLPASRGASADEEIRRWRARSLEAGQSAARARTSRRDAG